MQLSFIYSLNGKFGMNSVEIIDKYNATGVVITDDFVEWIRSDHAGEMGAVWIYKGARLAFWSEKIRSMAFEHGETEKQHLVVMDYLLPISERSKLIFLWKIMGFGLGFISSLFGFKAFCHTINIVETFVEKHYGEQIRHLERSGKGLGLLIVLRKCCEEEVAHKEESAERVANSGEPRLLFIWRLIVESFSNVAVSVAKKL